MAKTLIGRTVIAAAALAAMAGAAQAQNVTLYGRVDLGIQHSTKADVDGNGDDDGDRTELYNGGIRPSIWGLKGTEDLGGGLKAFFNLESHFEADTGTFGGGTGKLFRRQANVGLTAGWGTVTLGTQYTPAVLALLPTDPRAIKEQMSGLYAFALNQVGGSGSNDIGIFMSNAISYSNTFGPINFGVAYGFGEQADELDGGRMISAGVTYTGPVTVSGYYQTVENFEDPVGPGGQFSEQMGLGVAVPIGGFTARGQYIKAESDAVGGLPESDTDFFALGVDFAWNQMNTLTVAFYRGDNDEVDDDKTNTLIVSNDYAISKRTTIYAQVAIVDADDGATARTSVVSNAPVQDEKNTIVGIGISHNF
jgi:predicted porin